MVHTYRATSVQCPTPQTGITFPLGATVTRLQVQKGTGPKTIRAVLTTTEQAIPFTLVLAEGNTTTIVTVIESMFQKETYGEVNGLREVT